MQDYLYYYESLSNKEKEIYKKIENAINNMHRKVMVDNSIKSKNLTKILQFVLLDNPKYFYVNIQKFREIDTFFNKEIEFDYIYTREEQEVLSERILNRAKWIINTYCKRLSQYEQIKTLYKYFITTCAYSEAQYNEAHSIVGALLNEEAVCQGYAYAFKYLMDKLGIKCMVVSGHLGVEPHAWNIVWINSKSYHVDVTVGITISKDFGVRYDYLCVDDKFITQTHSFEKNIPECSNDDMNYFSLNGFIVNSEYELMSFFKNKCEGDEIFAIRIGNAFEKRMENELDSVMNKLFQCVEKGYEVNYSYQNSILYVKVLRR